ncbi:MAG: hypothetical protein AB8B69_00040 [Chitinophagales bacterium]
MQDFMVDYGIYIAQFLVAVAFLLSIIFPLIYTALNPKESMKTIGGVAIFAVILLILWFTSSSEITGRFLASEYSYVTEGIMKLVSFSITSGVLFTVGAFLLALVMEVVNAFK